MESSETKRSRGDASAYSMGCFAAAYPFPAVVAQDDAKTALLLCAVNPAIGGVLLSGDKGAGKSTLVRGLAELIGGVPFRDVPLNITEDRLVGSIDTETAIRQGRIDLVPGIMQEADGGFLYIDEVNLLPDHVAATLLQVASAGIVVIEREGISVSHPARFVLVGSMNPEEGPLRPELLDRFGLYVHMTGQKDPALRADIIRRRLDYEGDPRGFRSRWGAACREVSQKVAVARRLLPSISVGRTTGGFAAGIAHEGLCEGHRAEIVLCQTARAIAALDGRTTVTEDDVRTASRFALPHRIHQEVRLDAAREGDAAAADDRTAEDASGSATGAVDDRTTADNSAEVTVDDHIADDVSAGGAGDGCMESDVTTEAAGDGRASSDATADAATDAAADTCGGDGWEDIEPLRNGLILRFDDGGRSAGEGTGKRLKVRSHTQRGHVVSSCIPRGEPYDIALDATIRAAVLHGRADTEGSSMAVVVRDRDIRERVRESRTGASILFLVDASASMGARRRMGAVKGAVVALLSDAYQKRDRVAIVAFRGDRAEVLLEFTRSVDLAQRRLKDMRTGGRTPLAAGLESAYLLLKTDRIKEKDSVQYLVVVSDGRANVGCPVRVDGNAGADGMAVGRREGTPAPTRDPFDDALTVAHRIRAEDVRVLVLDTETGFMRLGFGQRLADALGAEHVSLSDITGRRIASEVAARIG